MSLLLETIKIENRQICNLEWHNARLNKSRNALLGIQKSLDLANIIKIPDDLGSGTYRCRVLYGQGIDEIQYLPHQTRLVRSLKMIQCNDIEYGYKYADRHKLEELFELRGDCDEILIIKDDYITDTSISNIVFRLPDGWWLTPHWPLLKGTMRTYLLETGQIAEAVLRVEDLSLLTAARMINCMMDLESGPVIEMDQIVF
jgi:4-amino-4-deoxychorismate lyase